MSEFQYKTGLGHVGSYQVSGIPYVTGALNIPPISNTPLEIIFPSVTQRIIIHNNHGTDEPIRVGFSANGVKGTNYWLVEAHQANGKSNDRIEMRVKTDRIYLINDNGSTLSGSVYVLAELTGIKLGFNLGASYSGSQGIG